MLMIFQTVWVLVHWGSTNVTFSAYDLDIVKTELMMIFSSMQKPKDTTININVDGIQVNQKT